MCLQFKSSKEQLCWSLQATERTKPWIRERSKRWSKRKSLGTSPGRWHEWRGSRMDRTLYRHHFQDTLSIVAWVFEPSKRLISRGKCNLEPAEGRQMGGEKKSFFNSLLASRLHSHLFPSTPPILSNLFYHDIKTIAIDFGHLTIPQKCQRLIVYEWQHWEMSQK